MIKSTNKLGIEKKKLSEFGKSIYKIHKTNIILKGKRSNDFPLKSGIRQGHLFNIVLESQANEIRHCTRDSSQ